MNDQQQHTTTADVTRLAVLSAGGAVACVLDQATKLWVRTSIWRNRSAAIPVK